MSVLASLASALNKRAKSCKKPLIFPISFAHFRKSRQAQEKKLTQFANAEISFLHPSGFDPTRFPPQWYHFGSGITNQGEVVQKV